MRQLSAIGDNTVNGGFSPMLVVDYQPDAFNVAVACQILTGGPTYKFQYTYDDPFTVAAGSIVWWDSSVIIAQTVNKDQGITTPFRACRVAVTAGTGTVKLIVTQSGPGI